MIQWLFGKTFGWPFWAYFLFAAAAVWVAEMIHKDTMEFEAEKVVALNGQPPQPVDLSGFALKTDRGPADEVHVTGWINTDLNYRLVKRTNGIKTGERYMYVLFGSQDPADARHARAAIVLTKAQKEVFAGGFENFVTGFANGHILMTFNGFGKSSNSYSTVASDALRDEGVRKAPDFVYLQPFLAGRAQALAPAALPGRDRYIGWGIAGLLVLGGLSRFRARRKSRGQTDNAPQEELAQPAAGSIPDPADPLGAASGALQAYADDSPLGRIHRRQMADTAHTADLPKDEDKDKDTTSDSGAIKSLSAWHVPSDMRPDLRHRRSYLAPRNLALYVGVLLVAVAGISVVTGAEVGNWLLPVAAVAGLNLGLFLLGRALVRVLGGLTGQGRRVARGADPFDRLVQQTHGG